MRVKIILSYNGHAFFGSQIQKSTPKTVLGELHHVLSVLGIEAMPMASGRTDRGVHATAQVCHLDLPPYWSDTLKLKQRLNAMLPSTIHIRQIKVVHSDFHARYSAKKRLYRYVLREGESNPFQADFVTFLPTVDFDALQQNIKLFEGKHDFCNFIKTGSDEKSTERIIYKTLAYKHKGYIILTFEANGFLRSQIRMMVGALLTHHRQSIQAALTLKTKPKIKPAPPNGLYLAKIKYEE